MKRSWTFALVVLALGIAAVALGQPRRADVPRITTFTGGSAATMPSLPSGVTPVPAGTVVSPLPADVRRQARASLARALGVEVSALAEARQATGTGEAPSDGRIPVGTTVQLEIGRSSHPRIHLIVMQPTLVMREWAYWIGEASGRSFAVLFDGSEAGTTSAGYEMDCTVAVASESARTSTVTVDSAEGSTSFRETRPVSVEITSASGPLAGQAGHILVPVALPAGRRPVRFEVAVPIGLMLRSCAITRYR